MADLFSLAKQMADNIPEDEKKRMQGMKMEDMVSSISQNVMKMMQDGNFPAFPPPTPQQQQQQPQSLEEEEKKPQKKSKIDFSDTPLNRFVEDIDFSDSDDDVISPKSNDLLYTLNVKLEDLYNGKQKKISFKRKRYKKTTDENGKDKYETFFEKKKVIVHIPPGSKDGHIIKFEKEADQLPGHEAGDVVITISEEEHETFDRDGDNLFLIKNISLSEIYGLQYSFTHLDKRIITVQSSPGDCLHLKDGIRKIKNLGMPIQGEEDKKGDLFIRFNLILPEKIDNIDDLKKIIPPMNETMEKAEKEYTLEEVTEEDMEKLEEQESDYESEEDDSEESDEEDDEDDEEEESDDEEEEESNDEDEEVEEEEVEEENEEK